jgi:type II secretory pathway pseudopilin PulG
MLVSAILLGALLLLAVPLLGWVSHQRRIADQRQYALLLLSNTIEELGQRPWDELSDDALAEVKLATEVSQFLDSAVMKATVEIEDEPIPTKSITVSLTWRNRAGETNAPVKLTVLRTKRGVRK